MYAYLYLGIFARFLAVAPVPSVPSVADDDWAFSAQIAAWTFHRNCRACCIYEIYLRYMHYYVYNMYIYIYVYVNEIVSHNILPKYIWDIHI